MRQHIEVVAWLNLAMGILGIFAAVVVFGAFGGAGLLAQDAEAMAILVVAATFVAGMVALLSVPALLGGWGLLRRKPWARVLVLILSFLNLFAFPIGPLIGGYSIWVLMQDEARDAFRG